MMPDTVNQSLHDALAALYQERARIETAIQALQNCLANLQPTKNVLSIRMPLDFTKKPRSTEGWTEEARLAAASRMRKFWENKKGRRSENPMITN